MSAYFVRSGYVPSFSGRGPLKQIIGYSMPPIGPFTDHWEDFVLEFEFKIEKGSLDLVPRQKAKVVRGGMSNIGDKADPISLTAEEYGKDIWVKVSVTVRGQEVFLKNENNGAEKHFADGEDMRITSDGGFCFWVPSESKVQIKNVRTKLVNSTRNLPF